jgi:DNA-binding NarL/FixJ family response regulator
MRRPGERRGSSRLTAPRQKIASDDGTCGVAGNLPAPSNLDVHCFRIESDEYVLLAFDDERKQATPERAMGGIGRLTATEREILALVLAGGSNASIAHARRVSPRTVVNQVVAIYQKLGVTCRRELRARARRDTTAK